MKNLYESILSSSEDQIKKIDDDVKIASYFRSHWCEAWLNLLDEIQHHKGTEFLPDNSHTIENIGEKKGIYFQIGYSQNRRANVYWWIRFANTKKKSKDFPLYGFDMAHCPRLNHTMGPSKVRLGVSTLHWWFTGLDKIDSSLIQKTFFISDYSWGCKLLEDIREYAIINKMV